MSEPSKQRPIMQKATAVIDALDDLQRSVEALSVKLTPYLLPSKEKSPEKENPEEPISPLEEQLNKAVEKINNLIIKIQQIDTCIR